MAIEKITENPFKTGSKCWKFYQICELDPDTGFSRIVQRKELEENNLGTDNGGSWCRSDGPLGKHFNVNRPLKHGKINSVQLTGYRQNKFSNKIDQRISNYYKGERCCVLWTGRSIEIDHKDGRKHDYRLHDNQTLDDFQPLSKTANVAKRQHCKVCAEDGERFDARHLGYSVPQYIGTERYNGTCIGCYWHDPKKFNEEVSLNYNKTR